MPKRIVIDGQLEAHSAHGEVRLSGVDGVLKMDFSNVQTLAALMPRHRLKAAMRSRNFAERLGQKVEVRVADAKWLTIDEGRMTYHRPLQLAAFAFRQWMRG